MVENQSLVGGASIASLHSPAMFLKPSGSQESLVDQPASGRFRTKLPAIRSNSTCMKNQSQPLLSVSGSAA